ncbi:MAG: ATP-binding protein [Deltaproteobacteria bacterium]|nr:ATP-binding protein [Deltaproteobacteria bacterium]
MVDRGGTRRFQARIAPDYRAVDRVVEAVEALLVTEACRRASFGFRLALREALVNAVRHGCHRGGGSEVEVEVTVGPERWEARVADDGPGFDWKPHLAKVPVPTVSAGRGIALIRLYGDEVEFNGRGNEIRIVCRPEPADLQRR